MDGGLNCPKATEPLQEDSLLLTTEPPVDLCTHLIDLVRTKG